MILLENSTFTLCCDNDADKIAYNILHNPHPLSLSQDMQETLQRLLWYVPNLEKSIQSKKLEIIEDMLFDEFCFKIILNKMEMSIDDIDWINFDKDSTDKKKAYIPKNITKYFQDSVCTNCQKIIFQRNVKSTLTTNILRHIRNMIAHGNFAIIYDKTGEEVIMGFDDLSDKKKSAIIKIKPKKLLNALRFLESPQVEEMLVQYSLENCGYKIIKQTNPNTQWDILAEKNGKHFAFEVKKYDNFTRERAQKTLDFIQKQRSSSNIEVIPVLYYNAMTFNEENKKLLHEQNIFTLDRSNLKLFLSGIDVLENMV